jgi:hypothetical protein
MFLERVEENEGYSSLNKKGRNYVIGNIGAEDLKLRGEE